MACVRETRVVSELRAKLDDSFLARFPAWVRVLELRVICRDV
jgi:hypothetical protein